MQTAGIPDLLAFVKVPQFTVVGEKYLVDRVQLWIEVKRHGATLSPAQYDFRAYVQAACLNHIVGGVPEVLDWLKARGVVK